MQDRIESALAEVNIQKCKEVLLVKRFTQEEFTCHTPDQNTPSIKVKYFINIKSLCQSISTTNH